MAGEQLLHMMQQPPSSSLADLVFGKVLGISPLSVQLDNKMVLPEAMLTLGLHVTVHKVKMTYKDRTRDGDDERTEIVTLDESLKPGDGVVMIRANGGQSFYILEKIEGETDG